jgi:putative PIN family toxin of toxin-antitoxin system
MGGIDRVVIDTNVWVSGVLKPAGPPGQILRLLEARTIEAVVTEELAAELVDVLGREHLRRRFLIDDVDLALLLAVLDLVVVEVRLDPPLRDPNDLPVIEAAVIGKARTIISGDLDLVGDPTILRWLSDRGIEVLTPTAFLATR